MEEPPLQFYMMDSVPPRPYLEERPGRWIAEREWPSRNVEVRKFMLNPHRIEAQAAPERALSVASPQSTGLASGDWGSFGVAGDVPADQSLDSFGSLEFDSEPLTERLEILGNAATMLDLAVDRRVASVTLRLIDVAPDGSGAVVARGFLNLAQRESREKPQPAAPGQRYRVNVPMTGTTCRPPSESRRIHSILADHMALAGAGDLDAVHRCLATAAAGTQAPGRRGRVATVTRAGGRADIACHGAAPWTHRALREHRSTDR